MSSLACSRAVSLSVLCVYTLSHDVLSSAACVLSPSASVHSFNSFFTYLDGMCHIAQCPLIIFPPTRAYMHTAIYVPISDRHVNGCVHIGLVEEKITSGHCAIWHIPSRYVKKELNECTLALGDKTHAALDNTSCDNV